MQKNSREKLKQMFIQIIQLILIILWGGQLIDSDAYYMPYLLILMITGVCCYKNMTSKDAQRDSIPAKYQTIVLNVFAAMFSCMVAASNYSILAHIELPGDLSSKWPAWMFTAFMAFVFLAGGYFAFRNIFYAIFHDLRSLVWTQNVKAGPDPKKVFFVSFVLLVSSRLIVLFFCNYPGVLTPDSINQMDQLMSGAYNNHHPFYHTILIKFFVDLGLKIFNDMNAAVATFSLFQILFTAVCFSFASSTMARAKAPLWMIITSMIFYMMMPYHIMFAITMWKDVIFGCFVLLLVLFIYRNIHAVGNMLFDHIMLAISAVGTCLFRSNGYFAFVFITAAFVLLYKFRYKKMLIIFASTLVICFVMTHTVLDRIGVEPIDNVEYLSIPLQQVARVVYEGCELSDAQTEALSEIVDLDKIPKKYKPYISDPVKALVRKHGNQQLLTDKKWDYLKLYLSIGLDHPVVYAEAWIDQTRGYWNAGYDNACWSIKVSKNDHGIKRTTSSSFLDNLLTGYLWMFTGIQGLRLFLSIGLFVWMDIVLFMIALLKKDKTGMFVSLPVPIIVLSLLISTPLFSKLRYIYAVFCMLPVVMMIVFRPDAAEVLPEEGTP